MTHQTKSYKKFVATAATATLVATALAPVASAATDFTDVSKDYKEAVDYIVNKGIAQGTTDTTFGTSQNISRGDAAVMIANALGLDTENAKDAGFQDVNNRVAGAVNAIVEAGIASGRTSSKFDPAAYITRQEMAKMLANAYELTATKDSGFTDVNKNWEEYVGALKEAGITLGKNETTFAPTANLTRGEFALFMFRAETMEETPEVPEETDIKVKSVSAITATEVTVEITAPEEDLVDAEVVVKDAAGKVVPTKAATIKVGSTEAAFQFVTPLTVNPTEQWTVNGVAYKASEFQISGVESVDVKGKYINVQFNQKVTELDASEISVRNVGTQRAYGVESVKLSSDGYSALVTLIGNDANQGILAPGIKYALSITKNGKVTTGEFVIPDVREDATVTAVDVENRTITLDKGTPAIITVPTTVAFDFNEALGRDVTVWLNEKNQVERFVYADETVVYDAVTVVTENSKKYVKTVNGNKSYEIDANVELDTYVTAAGVTTDVFTQTNGTTIESAKVVIGDNGKVKSIIANNFSGGSILVEKVTDTFVSSYNTQINLKDFQIVKDGKTITTADLKAGDVVFYHSTSGTVKFAEVFTNKVTGTISNFYDGEFKLNDQVYKYNGAKVLVDNKWETVTDSTIKPFTKTVNAFVNREGKLELVTGEVGEVTTLTTVGFVSKGAQGYKVGTKETIEFSTFSTAGATENHAVDVSKLQTVVVNGVLYTTSKLTSTQAGNANNVGEIQSFSFNGTPSGAANTAEVLAFTAKDATVKTTLLPNAATKLGYSLTHKTNAGELGNLIGLDSVVEVTKDAEGNVIGLNIKDVVKDSSTTTNPTASSNYETVATNLTATVKTSDTLISAGSRELKITADTPVFIEDDKVSSTTRETVESTTFGKLPVNTIDVSKGNQVKIYADVNDPNKVAYVVIEKVALGGDTTNITKTEGILKTVRFADNKLVEAVFVVKGEDKVFTKFEGSTAVLTQANIGQNILIDINNSVEGQLDGASVDTNALAPIAFTSAAQAEAVVNLNENAIKVGNVNYKLESDSAVYEVKTVNGEKVITKLNGLAELTSKFGAGKVLTVSTIALNNTYVDTVVVSDAPAASFNYTDIDGTVGTAITGVTPTISGATGTNFTSTDITALGLSINASTGEITGTPTVAVTTATDKTVNISYTDLSGAAQTTTATVSVTIAKGAAPIAPVGVGATDESAAGANDGTLTGVAAGQEYQVDGAGAWTPITGTTVTGLAPGSYVVRVAETPNYLAGTPAGAVVIN